MGGFITDTYGYDIVGLSSTVGSANVYLDNGVFKDIRSITAEKLSEMGYPVSEAELAAENKKPSWLRRFDQTKAGIDFETSAEYSDMNAEVDGYDFDGGLFWPLPISNIGAAEEIAARMLEMGLNTKCVNLQFIENDFGFVVEIDAPAHSNEAALAYIAANAIPPRRLMQIAMETEQKPEHMEMLNAAKDALVKYLSESALKIDETAFKASEPAPSLGA